MASVLVPLAQGCEELEAITVIDLLRRAGVEVVVAGLDANPVRASRGTVIVPDMTLDAAVQKSYDMVVLPGGLPGADHLNADPRIHALLQDMAEQGRYIAAICAAPKVLAKAGLLAGKKVTSYPGALDDYEGFDYCNGSVVRDGRIVTSRGPGTAMDFALELIESLVGEARRVEVEAALQRPTS
jgi:4-methyl-5(b-hydroxyethyl)-thiazole monophosphate biosynthesis